MRRFLFAVVVVALLIWIAIGPVHEFGLSTNACPRCGSTEDVVPIVYGKPGKEAMEMARQGQVKLGGCMVSWHSPRRHCRRCGTEWGRHWDLLMP
jgi:hypothetical protein